MRLQCPKCGTELLVDDDDIDQVATCTGCRAKLRVPGQLSIDDSADDEDGSYGDAPLTPGGGDDGKYEDLVDMTAMVDIVFFLLIFFMITTASGIISCIGMPPAKQENAAASRRTAADLDQDNECVIVRIDAQNRFFIDDIEFPTEADLRERLRGARALQAKKLLVKAHGDAFNGSFVMVQDLGYDIGFEEFMLSVAKEEEPQ
ncbi:MAG: hypothetical protein DWI21_03830 [Planctomycetota bacterium]|nr:MAG: hypothetical protein DWI21_03830 [Planctomycetota bacterium]